MSPQELSDWSFLAITYFWFPAVFLTVEALAVQLPGMWGFLVVLSLHCFWLAIQGCTV